LTDALVSVVIPVYDDEIHLPDAVSSARAQDLDAGIEVIVVDDGSPVDLTHLARSSGADRAVRIPTNQGPAFARDVGIALAAAPLIALLDSDDMMMPYRLRTQIEWLDRHPEAAGVIAHQKVVLEPGAERPRWLDPLQSDDGGGAVATSLMVRTQALLDQGAFDPSFRMAEDMEMLMRLQRGRCPIGRIERPLVIRKVHGRNATYDNDAMWAGLLRAVRSVNAAPPRPEVSVLVPAFNAARYLEEAVSSALVQDGPTLEVIVVDDGSEDSTPSVTAQLAGADPRVRTFTAPHGGTGAARNLGLLLARGRYVAPLDADDVWPPGRLDAQVKAMESSGAPDLVFGTVEEFLGPELDDGAPRALSPRPPALGHLAGTMLARREAMAAVGAFPVDPEAPEFLQWYARALEHRLEIASVPATVLRRRLHGANHSLVNRTAERQFLAIARDSLHRRRAAGHPTPGGD
jgi:glycosyltransferase involved in cell wall biosynthesis